MKLMKKCIVIVSGLTRSTTINYNATIFNSRWVNLPSAGLSVEYICSRSTCLWQASHHHMNPMKQCTSVVSNLNRSITADCKVAKFILQVSLTRPARFYASISRRHCMRAALASPVQMKPLKKYATVMSNLGAHQ